MRPSLLSLPRPPKRSVRALTIGPNGHRWPDYLLKRLKQQFSGSKPDPINPNVGWMNGLDRKDDD